MKRYLATLFLFAILVAALHYIILLTVRSPIPAQYGTREIIEVKRHITSSLPSPKIIILGGSNVLFGFDAVEIEKEIGIPTVNYGLHAAMRLQDLLDEPRHYAKAGDILILPLEVNFYADSPTWTDWQLENAIAWNPAALDRLSLPARLEIFARASSPQLSMDLVWNAWLQLAHPDSLQERQFARGPARPIIERWENMHNRNGPFSYNYTSIDERGDMNKGHTNDTIYFGPSTPLTEPAAFSAYSRQILSEFLTEMKTRGVQVYFAHTPYIVDGPVQENWEPAEAAFESDLIAIRGELLDRREQLFFPRRYFFDTRYHLNQKGREVHTKLFIKALNQRLTGKN